MIANKSEIFALISVRFATIRVQKGFSDTGIDRIDPGKRGLTLIELLITTAVLSILIFTIGYAFMIGLRLWNTGYDRSDIRTELSQALQLVSKNLRQAKSIDELTAGSITFTADLGDGEDTYRIYMYNSADSEPNPPYTQNTYELRWAKTTVTYGSGAVLIGDVKKPNPPSSKPFAQNGNVITLDFVVERGDQTVAMRTNVRPRSL
ncbi:MAG: type II secretion system protein [Candidatus Omnitrophica bacterium]|nr:type II secretion system protein [Candidatus Omnitrophota bacterium]